MKEDQEIQSMLAEMAKSRPSNKHKAKFYELIDAYGDPIANEYYECIKDKIGDLLKEGKPLDIAFAIYYAMKTVPAPDFTNWWHFNKLPDKSFYSVNPTHPISPVYEVKLGGNGVLKMLDDLNKLNNSNKLSYNPDHTSSLKELMPLIIDAAGKEIRAEPNPNRTSLWTFLGLAFGGCMALYRLHTTNYKLDLGTTLAALVFIAPPTLMGALLDYWRNSRNKEGSNIELN